MSRNHVMSVCLCAALAAMAPSTALAQSASSAPAKPSTADASVGPLWDNAVETVPLDAVVQPPRVMPVAPPRAERRPALLVPMYASFTALQAYDFALTVKGTAPGAPTREGNPVAARFAEHRGALIALKSASAVSAVLLGERLWKRHGRAAVALMAGINGAMAAIVVHNQRLVR